MRDRIYLVGFLGVAAFLLILGREQIRESVVLSWLLTFGGTTTAAVLSVLLVRFRNELQESRLELGRKQAEIEFARTVQQALFPRHLPGLECGLEFHAVCVPAAGISGDYYDILEVENGKVALAVADISGKGISAAILMANLQALLRVIISLRLEPGQICDRLNRHLHQVTDASRYATFFYGEWERTSATLRYVNAGHNAPLLLRRSRVETLDKGGIPLGVMPEWRYETGEVRLDPGDLLAIYSDGITEAGLSNGREFGEARLLEMLSSRAQQPLHSIQADLVGEVHRWLGAEPADDMTLVLVRAVRG